MSKNLNYNGFYIKNFRSLHSKLIKNTDSFHPKNM